MTNTHDGARELARYLAMLAAREPAGGLLELRYRNPRTPTRMRQHFHHIANTGRIARHILALADHSDVYIGVAPRRIPSGGRHAIHRGWVLWADIDQPGAQPPATGAPGGSRRRHQLRHTRPPPPLLAAHRAARASRARTRQPDARSSARRRHRRGTRRRDDPPPATHPQPQAHTSKPGHARAIRPARPHRPRDPRRTTRRRATGRAANRAPARQRQRPAAEHRRQPTTSMRSPARPSDATARSAARSMTTERRHCTSTTTPNGAGAATGATEAARRTTSLVSCGVSTPAAATSSNYAPASPSYCFRPAHAKRPPRPAAPQVGHALKPSTPKGVQMAGHAHPRPTGAPVKPTAKQLSYLRTLAIRTGQTFTPPKTRADASREIQRLRAATPATPASSAANDATSATPEPRRRHGRRQPRTRSGATDPPAAGPTRHASASASPAPLCPLEASPPSSLPTPPPGTILAAGGAGPLHRGSARQLSSR